MSGELARAAVAYAERGWRVFPLHWIREDGLCSCGFTGKCTRDEPGGWGKHPLTAHGLKDASADPQQVERWWRANPNANIAIVTGAESGLVVLDVDPPEGEEQLARIEAHHGPIPPTLTARSGKGGQHFYFAHPRRPVSNRQDVLGERASKEMGAIDVRGDGGYIIAPPSRNAAGAYEWTAPDETPPAQIPDYLFPVLENRSDLRKRKSADVPPASESTNGKGAHDTVKDLVKWLVKGGMRDLAEIARYADAVNEQQAQHGARRLAANEISSLVTWWLGQVKGDPEPTVESIEKRIGALWKTLDALTWLDTKPPEREYLFTFAKDGKQEGTVPRGRVGMFTGGGGQGKSWLLTQLAVCVASGAVWLGTYSTKTPGRVLLVLAEEDAAEMHRRIRWAVDGLKLSDMQRAVLRENLVPLPMMGEDVALTYTDQAHETRESAFCAFLRGKLDAKEEPPWRLVVLDPLSRFAGPEVEVDNAAATRFVQTLEKLTKVKGNPALVVSHHTAKASRNAEGDETAARGSSALVDGARWAAHVEAAVKKSTTTVSGRKKIHSFAVLKFTKVNYGPWPDELTLVRGENGVLHRASNDELAELERLKAEAKPTSRRSRGNIPAETDEKLVRLDASALDEEGL